MALTTRQRKERLGRGTQRRIAVKLRVSETTVSQVVNRKAHSLSRDTIRRVQLAVAEEIGVPVTEIFSVSEAA